MCLSRFSITLADISVGDEQFFSLMSCQSSRLRHLPAWDAVASSLEFEGGKSLFFEAFRLGIMTLLCIVEIMNIECVRYLDKKIANLYSEPSSMSASRLRQGSSSADDSLTRSHFGIKQ